MAMLLMKQMLSVVVAVAVTSLPLCGGKTVDSEASAPGRVQLRSVTPESVAPTRHGSLTLNFIGQGAQKSPHGRFTDHLASLNACAVSVCNGYLS